ncbi:MAG: hypothetical protein JXB62_08105 [Pirellulales bacterium]|nr:hypothetical protein [Pirellulales bacterium]
MMPSDSREARTGRREFLAWCSAAAASGVLSGGSATAADRSSGPLPTVTLGRHRISRLVVGSNPLSGYSYLGREMDQQMRDYFTPQRTVAFLQQCEREGINTHQFSAATNALEVYRTLREQGSKMHLIGLYANRADIPGVVEAVGPIGIAHHGGVTDTLFREGRSGEVRDFTKAVHDRGMLAGVSAHNPDCIRRVADEGWDVDFFMTCFYHITRKEPPADAAARLPVLEGPDVGYVFYQSDPPAMCEVIRQVRQPCLAFKILGAGRRCASQEAVREAFRFTYTNIKPGDAAIVGMYPRHFNQVGANGGYARQLAADPTRG